MPTLGDRLKRERKRRGWTLEEAADRLGLSGHSTYSNWEYNKRKPDPDMLEKLAELYGVSIDYLVTGNWKPIDDVAGKVDPEIAAKLKELGATVIQLNAELLERGLTREELEELLRMIIKLKTPNKL